MTLLEVEQLPRGHSCWIQVCLPPKPIPVSLKLWVCVSICCLSQDPTKKPENTKYLTQRELHARDWLHKRWKLKRGKESKPEISISRRLPPPPGWKPQCGPGRRSPSRGWHHGTYCQGETQLRDTGKKERTWRPSDSAASPLQSPSNLSVVDGWTQTEASCYRTWDHSLQGLVLCDLG